MPAGSLNYADLPLALEEIARVLHPDGSLTIYDFSPGRTLEDSDRLDPWFREFLARFPPAKDSWKEITPQTLKACSPYLRLRSFQPFAFALPYQIATYIDYLMTETNVIQAIQEGAADCDIRAWCRETLETVFGPEQRRVLFRGYIAHLTHPTGTEMIR